MKELHVELSVEVFPLCLSLGSGQSNFAALNVVAEDHRGWKLIDVCPDWYPTECYDLTTGIREQDETVSRIWAGDFLEHLPKTKVAPLLAECFRVLKPGGLLQVSVPDMGAVLPAWLHSNGEDTECNYLIWGQQGEIVGANQGPDSHLCGFTEFSLGRLLEAAGFTYKRVVLHGVWYELSVNAFKPEGVSAEPA